MEFPILWVSACHLRLLVQNGDEGERWYRILISTAMLRRCTRLNISTYFVGTDVNFRFTGEEVGPRGPAVLIPVWSGSLLSQFCLYNRVWRHSCHLTSWFLWNECSCIGCKLTVWSVLKVLLVLEAKVTLQVLNNGRDAQVLGGVWNSTMQNLQQDASVTLIFVPSASKGDQID